LHKIRINHACSELSSTELPIVSIAERCGYTSLSSFNRQFQKIMQISPSEYRAAHRTVAESVKLG
jgi:AraC-like DNA-binding protein